MCKLLLLKHTVVDATDKKICSRTQINLSVVKAVIYWSGLLAVCSQDQRSATHSLGESNT